MSRHVFEVLVAQIPLHGDMTRIINRSDAPIFSEMNLGVPDSKRICKLRQSRLYEKC